jgi:hypothetical protein
MNVPIYYDTLFIITDLGLAGWSTVNDHSALGCLHRVDKCSVAGASEVEADSIFRSEVYRVGEFLGKLTISNRAMLPIFKVILNKFNIYRSCT